MNDRTPRFLVTAGNTRERIDRVRDWGNIFTGNTGLAIANALSEHGQVDLLTSNTTHLQQLADRGDEAIRGFRFQTHADLLNAIEHRMRMTRYHAIFMTAAVSDYTPQRVFEVVSRDPHEIGREHWIVRDVQAGKVKSTHAAIAILGTPTLKIIDLFRNPWRFKGLLVKFKLEVGITPDELIEIGQNSRKSSGADYLVANTLDMVEGVNAGAFLLSDEGHEWIPRPLLAPRMAELVRATLITTSSETALALAAS
jgi:phosphopantothenate---cysteine ligase (CTP)